MQRFMTLLNITRKLQLGLAALLLSFSAGVHATFIDFGGIGNFTGAPGLNFPAEGLSVSGSDTLNLATSLPALIVPGGGLGVTGGGDDYSLDLGETISFFFDDPLTSLLLTLHDVSPPGNVTYGFNAFLGAVDLGFFALPAHATGSETRDLFSLVGGAFDSVTLSIQASAPIGLVIQSIEFETSPAVPVPATAVLVLLGLAAGGLSRRP